MLAPGTRIDDRYEILGSLSAGGMGHVYRARRIKLGDEVAIKVMLAGPESTPELRERFLRESKACAQLRHPNIVSILDYDLDTNKLPFMVMELLSGPSLREEIELEAPMTLARVVEILGPVASALQLAHDRGMTHRDLKPANIVVHRYESGERVYKVIDFGLVSLKAAGDETRLTNPNFFMGTLAYAAPEQMTGEPVTAKADIYALGMIVYEMLAAARPFDASGTTATVISQRTTAEPQSLVSKRGNLTPEVDRIVMKALATDPAKRWSSVAEFVDALEQAAGASTGEAAGAQQTGLLSRYELGPLLGRGRLGSVIYKATHRALGSSVAIRILKRDEHPNWDVVRGRFLVEARTLQVPHPGLLQVRDFGEDEKNVYLVTDFIDGASLRQTLAQAGAFPWPRAIHLLTQALEAVSALHQSGGFVSGVNPDMVRIRGSAGTEQVIMSTAGIRSVQDVLATMREQELRGQEASELELPYVAPEILMGGPPTIRSDVFTVGALAYQMVTAHSPFTAPSLPELMGKMLMSQPAAPVTLNASVPQAASDAILRALSGDQARRFESVAALDAALRGAA